MIFNILWEMVVSSNVDMKISAANLLKVSVSAITLLEVYFFFLAQPSPVGVVSDYF